ncbi:MAG: M23 family metallopeptidase [Alphaproteobacteria bacterium]|nr:M23 family metallopeptidase [Alphaproteobacteria bacterium]
MKKIILIFAGILLTQTGCDLQPKVLSLPDSVGDFISARYPALLADPDKFPEIYNSAATDYGVYAAPELYGTDTTNDYVMYASVDDYIVPPLITNPDMGAEIIEEDAQKDATVATVDDYILVPMYGDTGARRAEFKTDDVLTIRKPNVGVQQTTRVDLTEVVVASGDTLYSLSRKYSVPVNDLAVINKLNPPFNLKVGQKIRVPNLARVAVETTGKTTAKVVETSQKAGQHAKDKTKKIQTNKAEQNVVVASNAKKISSDPSKKLPKINARSSSKFSWPVRGKILSNYGAKTNGLFNDGINIGATRGAVVGAAENGVVAYAGNEVKGMGNLIIIQHDGGWMTVYAHMDSMVVRRGARVSVGQKIGTVGKTGKVDSPQLHFEIRKGTKAYNPTSYLKK